MIERMIVPIIVIVGLIGSYFLASYVVDELEFSKVPVETVECLLLNTDYLPSTLRTSCAPVIGGDGKMSVAVYSTGHSEKHTTIWDCGIYGRLTCDKKEVYRYAKQHSRLYIRSSSYDTRIMGIER